MSERYTRLFSLPENLYSVGAPVVIAAGALLKDNQTGKVLTQLKIQNISNKAVKAATVSIVPMDTVGKPLGEAVSYQYLDLNAGRDTDFGQKSPVALPDAATRAFSASVSEVIFVDNTVWTASETVWEPLSAPVSLEQAFDDKELVTQYRIKYGENCKCIFKREKDLWRCACGALNHENERLCHKCQKEAAVLAAFDLDKLKASKDKRLEIAKQKAAKEKAAAEAKAKKTKKIAMIATPIVVVIIIASVLFLKQQQESANWESYNTGIAMLEAGDYDAALAIFEELGGYRDSANLIEEAHDQETYANATNYKNSGEYSRAIELFEQLGNYQDSQDRVIELLCRQTMEQSISGAYEQIASVTSDDEAVQEIKALCETYIPYCGQFSCVKDGKTYTLTSDFYLNSNEDVCWKLDIPNGELLGVNYLVTYCFFTDSSRKEDLVVNSDMEVTDTWGSIVGKAKFKDGSIHITVSDEATEFHNRNYIKVN